MPCFTAFWGHSPPALPSGLPSGPPARLAGPSGPEGVPPPLTGAGLSFSNGNNIIDTALPGKFLRRLCLRVSDLRLAVLNMKTFKC
eukprot:3220622-Amphidinium_carterae.1